MLSQIFILFPFSDYCLDMVNILINIFNKTQLHHALDDRAEHLLCEDLMKLSLSWVSKQDTEGSSISTHFLAKVRFTSWSRILKLMALVKNWGFFTNHHWEDSSDHPKWICPCYYQLFTPHSTVHSTEPVDIWVSLNILVHVWD